jgi:hypothetical protein
MPREVPFYTAEKDLEFHFPAGKISLFTAISGMGKLFPA